MRKLKLSLTFILTVILATGCVPDSLTKFEEESIEKAPTVVAEAPVDFKDPSGGQIAATDLNPPVSLTYTDAQLEIGKAVVIEPEGDLRDFAVTNGAINANVQSNYNSKYTIPTGATDPKLPSGLLLNAESGVISGTPDGRFPTTTFNVTLTYFDQGTQSFKIAGGAVAPIVLGVETDISSDFRVVYTGGTFTRKMGLKVTNSSNFTLSSTPTEIVLVAEDGADTNIAAISLIDSSSNLFVDILAPSINFKIGDVLDNKSTFFAPEATVEEVSYYFSTTDTIGLTIGAADLDSTHFDTNNVQYSISPDLPAGLQITTTSTSGGTTFLIDGTSGSAITSTEYTLTAKNTFFSKTYKFNLGLIDAPKGLSYSDLVVFKTNSKNKFKVGSPIASNFTPPLVAGGQGKVEYIHYDGTVDYLVVKVFAGEFKHGQKIDNSPNYVDELAIIDDTEEPQLMTAVLNLTAMGALKNYKESATNNRICQDIGALDSRATIVKKTGTTVFIAQAKNPAAGGVYPGNFIDDGTTTKIFSNTVCNDDATSASITGIEIDDMWSKSIIVNTGGTVGGGTVIQKGFDIITALDDNSGVVGASGYVSKVGPGNSYIVDTANEILFDDDQEIEAIKPYIESANEELITNVNTNVRFELNRGDETIIAPLLIEGQDITFQLTSTSPDLPAGLVLDEKTGRISGTPTEASSNATYDIKAINVIGSETISFDIHVNDYFEITSNTDNAPDFILHKSGEKNSTTKCRINREDILSTPSPSTNHTVDVNCTLEAGELELFDRGLQLSANGGPGICEFTTFKPYSYYKAKPAKTAQPTQDFLTVVTGNTCKDGAASSLVSNSYYISSTGGLPTLVEGVNDAFDMTTLTPTSLSFDSVDTPISAAGLCAGFYELDSGDVNCDTGSIRVIKLVVADPSTPAANDCKVTRTTTLIDCGGLKNNCLSGPATELGDLNFTNEDNGIGEVLFASNDGGEIPFTFKSPSSLGHDSNVYLANYVNQNSCSTSGASTEYSYAHKGWYEYASSTANKALAQGPFQGASPFYEFNCLDAAYDTKARIRVMVREWDRKFDEDSLIDSFFPDRTIAAADKLMDAGTEKDNFGEFCNDIADWNDLLAGRGGFVGCDDTPTAPTVPTTATGAETAALTAGERTVTVAAGMTIALKRGDTIEIVGATPLKYTVAEDVAVTATSFTVKEFAEVSVAAGAISRYQSHSYPTEE